MEKLLITGANGLLGSSVVECLNDKYEIHALIYREPDKRIETVKYHLIDLTTDWSTSKLPNDVKAVFHLAQSSRFREYPEQALDVFRVNVDSTARLLDYARKAGAKHFLFASSGGVYGASKRAVHENSPIVPYGKLGYYLGSKLCGEILSQSYAQFMDVAILRFFFMYGKSQRRSMLIPRLVDNIRNGKPINLQGRDGIQINPVHVSDAVQALGATLGLEGSHTVNIAGPEILSLRTISEIIGCEVGVKPVFHVNEDTQAKDMIGNNDRMKKLLAEPIVYIAEGTKELL